MFGLSLPLINAARAPPANTTTITLISVRKMPALFTSLPSSLNYRCLFVEVPLLELQSLQNCNLYAADSGV